MKTTCVVIVILICLTNVFVLSAKSVNSSKKKKSKPDTAETLAQLCTLAKNLQCTVEVNPRRSRAIAVLHGLDRAESEDETCETICYTKGPVTNRR